MKIMQIEHPFRGNSTSCVAAIGHFDGLHLGHQAVITQAQKKAQQLNLPCCLLTFYPHPRAVLNKEEITTYLTPLQEKYVLLEEMGVDLVYVVHFSPSLSQLTPQQFIESMLIPLGVKEIVCGFDFRFGKGGSGTPDLLKELSGGKIGVEVVSPVDFDDLIVSSSYIRKIMQDGKMEEVTQILGRPYVLRGRVIQGEQRGRQLGFPTANIQLLHNYYLPRTGVYGVRVSVDERDYHGVLNIGYKPTFHSTQSQLPFVEIHLLDFRGNLYGKEFKIDLCFFIRTEQKFNTVNDLVDQIKADIMFAKGKFLCYTK